MNSRETYKVKLTEGGCGLVRARKELRKSSWRVVADTDLKNLGGRSIFVQKDDEARCRRGYLFNRNERVITNQH